jgi:DNA-binding NarL/FixJ family response regulator
MRAIRVLIADENTLLRQGLRRILGSERDIEVVGEAADNQELIRLARELSPDVIVMDITLPGFPPADTIARVKAESPSCEIIVLSMANNRESIVAALRAGAISYILKDVESSELIHAIQIGSTGKSVLHPKIATKLVSEFHRLAERPAPPATQERGLLSRLTPREREVLIEVAGGLTNQQIADRLFISEKTVRNHISNFMRKLGISHRTRAAILAIKLGLVSLEDDGPPPGG